MGRKCVSFSIEFSFQLKVLTIRRLKKFQKSLNKFRDFGRNILFEFIKVVTYPSLFMSVHCVDPKLVWIDLVQFTQTLCKGQI